MTQEIILATVMRPKGASGVQTHVQQFSSYLRAQPVRFRVATPFDAPRVAYFPIFAVRKILQPLSGTGQVWWYRHWHGAFLRAVLARHLADGKRRVVYAQCPVSAWAALKARANPSQKVVLAVHFNESQAEEWALGGYIPRNGTLFQTIRRQEDELFRRLDGLVFVSDFMRRALLARQVGIETIPYAIVPNFIADAAQREAAAHERDLVTVGTLEPRKNQRFVLLIAARAKEMGHRLAVTVIGDGKKRRALEQEAVSLGIRDQVQFTGHVDHAAERMASHRAYIHGALIENLPIVIIEAMSRGLPIFAPPVGGIPEMFEDGVEGRYLLLDDATESAARVVAALGDPLVLGAMSAAARDRFLRYYELSAAAGKLLAFLLGSLGTDTLPSPARHGWRVIPTGLRD